FLFTTTAVGSFTFVFVIFKLVVLPVILLLIRKWKLKFGKNNQISSNNNSSNQSNLTNNDLKISSSNLNLQEYDQQKHNDSITNDIILIQEQSFASNQDINRDEYNSQL
ncbi:unnamed protein product, partial [Adineta steineri]